MSDLLEQDLREAERCHAAGDIPRAVVLYRAILEEHPYFSHTAFNLANILKEQQHYEEAEHFFRQALAAEPGLSAAALNLAFVLQEQGRYDEAIAINSALVADQPELSDAVFNLACLQLLTGHYVDGWRGYEQRFHTQFPVPERHTHIPLWTGEQRSGLKLLVHTEQGFGDSLQISRYLPVLAQAGLQVWLETTSELAPLLRRLPGLSGCILRGEALPDVDFRVPIMSLPGLMGTTEATIPPPVVHVDEALCQRMTALLPASGKLRVGICWAGRQDLTANRKRTCPPNFFKIILDTPGISVISLQTGHPEELAMVDERLIDLSGIFADFHHTAALIANLDLIITIDSAVAHLAATVGTPTWLLLPHVPDWRWLLQRSDSPWYPAMRLFRQPVRNDWTTVMQEVSHSLTELVTTTATELINRGAAFDNQGDFTKALLCYQQAIDRVGFSDIVCYNMGNTLMNLGQPEHAEQSYRHALRLNPAIAEAHHNLARIYKECGELPKAYEQLESALKLRPRFPDALHTLGELFLAEERFTDAISALRSALQDVPTDVRIWNTLGIVYQCAERDREAKECYEKALEYNPDYLHALNNLGAVCLSLGKPLEGADHLYRLIRLSPEYADGHWNLAGCLLAAGLYPEGWREYEWRWQKNNPIEARHQQIPRWDGSSLAGRRILIWAEQGFGDTIQFIRYIPQVKACGGTIILECQTEAIRVLCEGVDGIAQVIVRGEQLPTVDVQAPLLSLPGIFGTTLTTIPATVPYLHPDAARKQRWQQLVEPDKGIRIGLVWGGRQTLRNRRRSSQLADFAPLANLPGAIFFSLQIGEQANEAVSPPPGMVLRDHTAQIRDFADTAALIDCLDLVITIDTSVAHLAGALGKPSWILLPTAADWRWLLNRNDSPWYPSATLLRQTEAGNWQSVMNTLARELTARLQGTDRSGAADQMAAGDHFRDVEEWQNAVTCYRSALEHNPAQPDAHLRLGGSLLFLNRHEEAIKYLRQAVQLAPDDPAPHITLALACLATGREQEGWQEFEWRRKNINEPLPDIPELPQLNSGQRLDGCTVLIHTEQGFGDTIQMARYLPYLTATGATIILSAPLELADLICSVTTNLRVIPHGEPLPAAHFQTLLMSLPHLLAQIVPAIPATVPYLAPSPELVEQWRQRLEPLHGMKIGIAWQGRDMGKSGYRRALTLAQLAPLFALTGISFVTLQPGCLTGTSPEWHNLYDQSPHIHTFSDTAALIANLDLVISVDTAVAHLAGALGCPCWVALLHSPDWRWCPLDRTASSWYPATTLFRQQTPGHWDAVVAKLAGQLERIVSPRIWVYRDGEDFDSSMTVNRPTPLTDRQRWPELGIREANSPDAADLFLFPYYLEHLAEYHTIEGMWHFLEHLPYFVTQQNRHILFSDHDCEAPFHSEALWFRTSINPHRRDPSARAIPYQVSIPDEYLHFDLSRLRHHVTFTGFVGSLREREAIINGIIAEPALAFHLDVTDTFHLHQEPLIREERRLRYLGSLSESLCVLCPRGTGSSSLRFFETLAAGRIAIIQEPCLLPFSDRIAYERFVITIPEGCAHDAGKLVLAWLSELSSDELHTRCREARHAWERYLSPQALPASTMHSIATARLTPPVPEPARPSADGEHDLNSAAKLCMEGRLAEAKALLEAAVTANPRSATIHVTLGGVELQLGNNHSAEAHLCDAILYDHRCYHAYLLLGNLRAKSGDAAAAVGRYNQASMIRPDETAPYESAEPLLRSLGRLEDADYCRRKLTALHSDQHPS